MSHKTEHNNRQKSTSATSSRAGNVTNHSSSTASSTATVSATGSSSTNPTTPPNPLTVLGQRSVWLPLLGVAIAIAIVDIVLMVTNAYANSQLQILNQVLFYGLGAVLLVASVWLYHKQKAIHAEQDKLLSRVQDLHKTKLALLGSTSAQLGDYQTSLSVDSQSLRQQQPDKTKMFANGLAMLSKLAQSLAFVSNRSNVGARLPNSELTTAIQPAVADYRQQALAKGLTIETLVPPSLPVRAYDDDIDFIVRTLLDNAIKFSGDSQADKVGGSNGSSNGNGGGSNDENDSNGSSEGSRSGKSGSSNGGGNSASQVGSTAGTKLSHQGSSPASQTNRLASHSNKITLRAVRSGKHVSLTVADHGQGIPTVAKAHLFEPFSRGTSTEAYDKEGIGMGLYNLKFLVDSLGGTIQLRDNKPQGLVVEVRLRVG